MHTALVLLVGLQENIQYVNILPQQFLKVCCWGLV